MAADVLTRLLSPFGGLVRVVMCRLRAQGIGGGGAFWVVQPPPPHPPPPWQYDYMEI